MALTADRAERARRNVARLCATATSDAELLNGLSARLRPIVDYDAGVWMTTDPATTLFTHSHVEGFPDAVCQPWFDNELLVEDVHKFTDLARGPRTARISDLPDPTVSDRWTGIMRPSGFDAEVRSTFVDTTGCWGVLEFHREVGRPDFSDAEVSLLRDLGAEVAAGVRRLAAERRALADARTDGPGLLIATESGEIYGATEAGQAWLELLAPMQKEHVSPALHALHALIRSDDDRPRRIRLRAADGRWVTLHASPRVDMGGSAVIVEPTQAHEIAEVLALAHGLSERERDVVLALARGGSTEEIAQDLFISPHTVRDHLKSAFAKVGVSGRTELVARLFHDHYAETLFGGDHASHTG